MLAGSRLAAQQATETAADSTRITGVVRSADGAPIARASIELVGTAYRTTTTDSGAFTLVRVAPGTYTLVAHNRTRATARAQVTATAGQDTRLELTLTAAGATPATATASGAETLPTVKVEAQRGAEPAYGPVVSATGANDYSVTATEIANLPEGENATITDVLTRMPGVAIDQNQQIHIRNTEGPQFQYQINSALVPIDINTNPPFISMFNPMFVSKLDLLDGILPSRYSYATGGIVDIQTKAGCDAPGGNVSLLVGQRLTVQPSAQYAGCAGKLSYYLSGQYADGQTAFSSATPGPNPIHNLTNQGQGFGYFSYPLNGTTELSVTLSAAASNNQLPNVPNLAPQFTLNGVSDFNSGAINSYLNFRDYLGMVSLSGTPDSNLRYQISYAAHSISQRFKPDDAGERTPISTTRCRAT